MIKVQLALMTAGTCALVLASTTHADAAPPAKGATAPMSIQPTARPVDVATPPASTPRAEPKLAENSIYAEGLGAGLAYSLNYERMVADEVAVRAGFSYMSFGASATSGGQTSSASATFMTFPITASYLGVRSGKHALELGGGTTLMSASGSASGVGASSSGSGFGALGNAMVGYRIHPVEGAGFNFRIGAMALMGKGVSLSSTDPSAFGVIPWFYLSLGASF
ncbi:MAG TPA: hypothetical protein VK550_26505 [Polyangiaceae bacterium]|nr:hypothetical protein [Polyangiaceae bacterium]